jgi:hypothetical protein
MEALGRCLAGVTLTVRGLPARLKGRGQLTMRLKLSITFLLVTLVSAPSAHALDRDVKAVLTTSFYGAAVGTVLGLASYPFNGNPRSIAIGTSIGLYLGIIAGFYYIGHREDPGNPLNRRQGANEQFPEPTHAKFLSAQAGPPRMQYEFTLTRF